MDEEVLNEAMECYNEDENRKVTIAAAEVEYENYCKHTRVEEIMDFAKKINAKKIRDRNLCRIVRKKAVSWQIFCADMALRCMVSAVKPNTEEDIGRHPGMLRRCRCEYV